MFRQTCTAQRDRRVCVRVEGVHQELRTVGRRSVISNAAPTAALCYIAPSAALHQTKRDRSSRAQTNPLISTSESRQIDCTVRDLLP